VLIVPLCFRLTLGLSVVGGSVVAVVGAPVVLGTLGFTAAGIAAGSVGAGMMSSAATTGVGMAVVAALQSAGAAGVGAATALGGGAAGGILAGILI
jgi:hypothetical protein